jgi:hypothetical protein
MEWGRFGARKKMSQQSFGDVSWYATNNTREQTFFQRLHFFQLQKTLFLWDHSPIFPWTPSVGSMDGPEQRVKSNTYSRRQCMMAQNCAVARAKSKAPEICCELDWKNPFMDRKADDMVSRSLNFGQAMLLSIVRSLVVMASDFCHFFSDFRTDQLCAQGVVAAINDSDSNFYARDPLPLQWLRLARKNLPHAWALALLWNDEQGCLIF